MGILAAFKGNPDTSHSVNSQNIHRRGMLIQSGRALFGLSVLSVMTSCGHAPQDAPPTNVAAMPPEEPSPPFDELKERDTIIGKTFTIEICSDNDATETVEVTFLNATTLDIDGDTHTIESISANNQSLQLDATVPIINQQASTLITDVRCMPKHEGILIASDYGTVAVSHGDLSRICKDLRHPADEETATGQSIETDIDTKPSFLAWGVLQTAQATGLMTKEEAQTPTSCSFAFKSERVNPLPAPPEIYVDPKETELFASRMTQWWRSMFSRKSKMVVASP